MRVLVFLLLWSNAVPAQRMFFWGDSAFVSSIDLPARQPFDTAHAYKKVTDPYIYVISDKDLYDLFGYNRSMLFYGFNFTDYHILGMLRCLQCQSYCRHEQGETDCHRNLCNKEWIWTKRENKKAFVTVPRVTVPCTDMPGKTRFNDTIFKRDADTSTWYTTGYGDCFARFSYTLLADRFHPTLVLKELNYYGGCRAGGSKQAAISFIEPKGILYKVKRTVLMPKGHSF
jgi:hypothetical protein